MYVRTGKTNYNCHYSFNSGNRQSGSSRIPDEVTAQADHSDSHEGSRRRGRGEEGSPLSWTPEDDVYNIKQLSRELLAHRNLFQLAHPASEYLVMESRLRKLLENHSANISDRNSSRSSIHPSSSSSSSSSSLNRALDFSSGPLLMSCEEVDSIGGKEYIASGWTKAVFKGVIPPDHGVASLRGRMVALKTVDIGGQDVTSCMDNGSSLQFCYHRAAEKIVKEIVLLQALSHQNVLQVRHVYYVAPFLTIRSAIYVISNISDSCSN